MKKILTALAAAAALAATQQSARADSGLSLGIGEHFAFSNNGPGASNLTDFSGTYDVGPHVPVVPIRANLQFDYATGSGQSFAGGGIGARLTTPLYAGIGLGIYSVTGYVPGGPFVASGGGVPEEKITTTGFGSNVVLGTQLLAVPGGARLDLEAGYKQLPTSQGLNLGGATVGVRLRF